jgi:adenine phosphoribosyltransferase
MKRKAATPATKRPRTAEEKGSERMRDLVRAVPDFPSPGILFRDITPLLEDVHGFKSLIDAFAGRYRDADLDKVVGIESRGFILGAALAYALGAGFVVLRKPGKLPRATRKRAYDLEYGSAELHMHEDSLKPGERVVIIDDVIATGGTLQAAIALVADAGAVLHELAVAIELDALGGRARIGGVPLHSVLRY